MRAARVRSSARYCVQDQALDPVERGVALRATMLQRHDLELQQRQQWSTDPQAEVTGQLTCHGLGHSGERVEMAQRHAHRRKAAAAGDDVPPQTQVRERCVDAAAQLAAEGDQQVRQAHELRTRQPHRQAPMRRSS